MNRDRDKVLAAERILGVKTNASVTEIKERYRFLAQAYHPDKFASESQKKAAEQEFKKIDEAYQTLLKDSESKRDFRNYNTEDKPESAGEAEHRSNSSTQEKDTKLGGWSRIWIFISIIWVGFVSVACYIIINDHNVTYVSRAEQLAIFDQTDKPLGVVTSEEDKAIKYMSIEFPFDGPSEDGWRGENFRMFVPTSGYEEIIIKDVCKQFVDNVGQFASEKRQKQITEYIRYGILWALGLPLLLFLLGKSIAWIGFGFRKS